jgi:hypothetical protein
LLLAVGPLDRRDAARVVYTGLSRKEPSYFGLRIASSDPQAAGPYTLLLGRHRQYGMKDLLVATGKALLIVPAVAELLMGIGPNHVSIERIAGVREPGGALRFGGRWVRAACVPLGRADLEAALSRATPKVAASMAAFAASRPAPGWRHRHDIEGKRTDIRSEIAATAALVGWDDRRVRRWGQKLAATEEVIRQRQAQFLETPAAPRGSGAFDGDLVSVREVRSACDPEAARALGPLPKGFRHEKGSCLLRFTLRNDAPRPFSLSEIGYLSDLGELQQGDLYSVGGKYALHSPDLQPGREMAFLTEVQAPRELVSQACVKGRVKRCHHVAPPIRPYR